MMNESCETVAVLTVNIGSLDNTVDARMTCYTTTVRDEYHGDYCYY